MADAADSVRVDKWLWAARFFKTRQLAAEAVQGGRVHLNGRRTKPGKPLHVDDRLTVTKGELDWDITVLVLARQRRPASEAVEFYLESPVSHARRQAITARKRAQQQPRSARPDKRQRRLIHRFKDSIQ
jgi:ribosome-associated heat shock protein Hsp15